MKRWNFKNKVVITVLAAVLLLLILFAVDIGVALVKYWRIESIKPDTRLQITRLSISCPGKILEFKHKKSGVTTQVNTGYWLESAKPDLYLKVNNEDVCFFQENNSEFLLDINNSNDQSVRRELLQFNAGDNLVIEVWDKNLRVLDKQLLPDTFLFAIVINLRQNHGSHGAYRWEVQWEEIER